ncbi:hypothetical protein H257_18009 [Aphanomyces astaci]|uniref:Uncharacterized protein n=1 Tax=Aphanomyces astaci TaxID=112090 RepID=W4FEC2_APHAT|nr:hypothetical protein H257_18009 [Aphanomyces astaci]ETV65234.1 hypothetical protein H257_18009 [Aphanomyces astaci]|eukprot:XP_009845301.1 hypothetical protein H257_18009 [Aphanomyces astaci]
MSLLPSSMQPFVGISPRQPPASGLHALEDGLLDYAPQVNGNDALNLSKLYIELDQVEHCKPYVVDPTLSETDRDARFKEIKAHTTAIQREFINS